MTMHQESDASFSSRKGNRPRRVESDPWEDFRDYACRNASCVMSRFDRLSMASMEDARCPICGRRMDDVDEGHGTPKTS